MANLTDKSINNTYQSLLKTIDNTEINGSTEISDGLGNGTGITISNDGQITTDGTISFGTLKDSGENISISKFVDEADGIANNDNDTSIPTSAAVVDYVENKITLDDLDFTADTGSGSVDLDSQTLNINGGDNVTTEATGQTVTINATGTNLSNTSTSTVVNINSSTGGNTSIGSATSTNAGILTSSDKDKLDGISSGAEVNPNSTDDLSEGSTNLYYTEDRVSANSDVVANTAKVGITTQQSADITANNAKVGITTQQASDIIANNDKISFDSASSTKLATIEEGAEVNPTSTDDLSEGTSNLYYTDARVSANTDVAANTAKVGITTDQADAITANTAKNSYPSADSTKVGFISVTQAVDLDTIESDVATNNAKTGITSQQALDITTNNAKISFDSTSSTKLAGIAENATNVTNNNQITNGAGYINEAAQTIHTNAIGNAIDFSARVTLDGGVAEGASGIIKNLQNIL